MASISNLFVDQGSDFNITVSLTDATDTALNLASTHQTEIPQGFSEVGENKQLLIAIVVQRFFIRNFRQ